MANDWAVRFGLAAEPAPQRNALVAGVSSGIDQLQGLGYSAIGGVADALGVNSVRDWANERADLNQWEAQKNGRPDLENIEDQSVGTALPFLGYQLAKQLPMLGAVAGAQMIPGVGQAATATGLARLGAIAPRALGGGGLEAGASFAARRAALEQGTALGSSTLVGSALGFGSLYGESVEGGDPSPFKALALAPLYGAAEAVVPGMLRGGLKLPQQFSGGMLSRMGKAGLEAGIGEAGTELFQNELEMGMRSDLTPDQIASRRLNSAAIGGLVGGSYGTVGGIKRPMPDAPGGADLLNTTQEQEQPTLKLSYSPLAGAPVVFPDGSVALNEEEALRYRYAPRFVDGPKLGLDAAQGATGDLFGGAPSIATEQGAAAAPTYDDLKVQLGEYAGLLDEAQARLDIEMNKRTPDLQEVENLRQIIGLYGDAALELSQQMQGLSLPQYGQRGLMSGVNELVNGSLIELTTDELNSGFTFNPAPQQPPQALGFNPLAGTPTVFPDGSVALGSEAELQRRYQPQLGDNAPERIRGEIAQGMADGHDKALAVALTTDIVQNLSDATALQAKFDGYRERLTKALDKLTKQVTDGSNMMTPEEYAQKRSVIETRIKTLDTAYAVASKRVQFPQPVQPALQEAQAPAATTGAADVSTASATDPMVAGGTGPAVSDPGAGVVPDGSVAVVANGPSAATSRDGAPAVGSEVQQPGAGGQDSAVAATERQARADEFKRQEAFSAAIGAPKGRYELLNSRRNPALGSAAKKGDWGKVVDALSKSKNVIVARVGELAKRLQGVSVKIDSDAREDMDADRVYGDRVAIAFARAEVEALDKLRDLKARVDAGQLTAQQLSDELNAQSPAMTELVRLYERGAAPLSFEVANRKLFEYAERALGGENSPTFITNIDDLLKAAGAVETGVSARDGWEQGIRTTASATVRVGAVAGSYDAATKTIKVGDFHAADEGTMTHEIGHALLVDTLANPRPNQRGAVQRMQALYEHVKKALEGQPRTRALYGLTSLQEFAAEGYGNPKFQYELSRIQYQGTSAWDKFTQYVADLLGLTRDNAFIEFLALSEELAAADGAPKKPRASKVEAPAPKRTVEQVRAELYAVADRMQALQTQAMALLQKNGREPRSPQKKAEREGLLDERQRLMETEFNALDQELSALERAAIAQKPKSEAPAPAPADNGIAAMAASLTANGDTAPAQGSAPTTKVKGAASTAGAKADLEVLERQLALYNSAPQGTGVAQTRKHEAKVKSAAAVVYAAANDPEESPEVRARAQEILDNDIDPKDLPGEGGRWRSVDSGRNPGKLSAQAVEQTVQATLKRIPNAPNIKVVASPQAAGLSPAGGDTGKGLTTADGDIYVFSDFAESRLDVVKTVFHELFHRGLKTRFPANGPYPNLNKVYVEFMLGLAATDPKVRELANRFKSSTAGQQAKSDFEAKGPLTGDRLANFEALAVEEALAEMAEQLQDGSVHLPRNLVARAAALLARAAEKLGMSDLAQWLRKASYSEAEQFVMETLRMAGRPVEMYSTALLFRGRGAQQALAQTPKPLRTALDSIGMLAKDAYNYVGLRMGTTRGILREASKFLPSAAKYARLADEAATEKVRAEKVVASILEDFKRLSKGEQTQVNRFLMESTYARKWGYKPAWINATVTVDEKLAAMLPESAAARSVIDRVFKHGSDNLKAMHKAIIDSVNSDYDPLIKAAQDKGDTAEAAKLTKAKAADIKKYDDILQIGSYWPYAPLKRFGKQAVVGKSQMYLDNEEAAAQGNAEAAKWLKENESNVDHYVVSFVDTKREARALVAKLQASGKAYADFFERLEDNQAIYGGAGVFPAFQRLRSALKTGVSELDAKAAAHVDKLVKDLYLSLLSENSARQAGRQRRDIAGADEDMMKSFATQGRATAHFISSLKTTGPMTDVLLDMKAEAAGRAPGRSERSEFFNEIARRHGMGLEYESTPLMDRALATNSFWMLLSNPAYFVTNATQPWLVSLPVIAGKHGMGRASAAMWQAYSNALPLLKFLRDDAALPSNATEEQREIMGVLRVLMDRGRIDISMDLDIGRFETDGGALGQLASAADKLRGVAEKVEMMNRVATAIAAYQLEKSRNASPDKAIDYAEQVILDTHGDYSGFNAPRIMRTGIGRLTTQFRKFQLIQLALMHKLVKDAFAGASEAERKAAWAALAYTSGVTFAAGGLMAMPGYAAFSFLASALGFGNDDEPDDDEATLRRWLRDAGVDSDLANMLLKGIPKMLGVDFSSRVGMGGMLSLLPYTDIEPGTSGYQKVLMGLAGPMLGGAAARAYDGASLVHQGDYVLGLEKLLPRGLANAMQGYRFATEGMTTRRGEVVLSSDEVSVFAAAAQVLGLPTNTVTDAYFVQGAKFKADKFYATKTAQMKDAYIDAYKANDVAAMAEVREDWRRIQDARKALGYTAQSMSDLIKAPMERAKRERNTTGGAGFVARNKRFVEDTASLVE